MRLEVIDYRLELRRVTRNKSEIQKRIMKLCERPFFEKNMFENQSSMHLINIQYYGLFLTY